MPRPVVLVHGAWHGAWCWERVVPLLQDAGLLVHAVELPFSGARDDIACVRSVLEGLEDPVVVGHSYGGYVMTGAAEGRSVGHLLYLCAFMPDIAEDPFKLMAAEPPTALTKGILPGTDGTISVDPEVARRAFYADCEPEHADAALARLRPMSALPVGSLSGRAAWRDNPSTYVVCLQDEALSPDFQRRFAARANSVFAWDTSHSPFVSQPELVADLIHVLATAPGL